MFCEQLTNVRIHNVFNDFIMLANTQFVENVSCTTDFVQSCASCIIQRCALIRIISVKIDILVFVSY